MKTDREILDAGYLSTGKVDVNGKTIFQGSIINADGYMSDLNDYYFHCVAYEDGEFTSDIYGDSDPLSMYKEIEVVGHVLDYLDIYETGDWSGNLGAGIMLPATKITTIDFNIEHCGHCALRSIYDERGERCYINTVKDVSENVEKKTMHKDCPLRKSNLVFKMKNN